MDLGRNAFRALKLLLISLVIIEDSNIGMQITENIQ
jgi:hypothetical protein